MQNRTIANSTLQNEIVAIRPSAINQLIETDGVARQIIIQGNIATIPIYGVLRQHKESKGANYDWIQSQCQLALNDPKIKQINLEIDSPGGEVLGVSELAEYIYASKKIKPIIALIKNMACSAAYWIASACQKIILAGETTILGSIGVLELHTDLSESIQRTGIKITEIASGKYKHIASANAPLSSEGKEYLQDRVNQLYNIFVQSIAKYRKIAIDKVIAVADGREYIGSQAITLGLADAIQTSIQGEISMTPEEMQAEINRLKQENEELKKKLEQQNKPPAQESAEDTTPMPDEKKPDEKLEQAVAMAVAKAQAAERARIIALDELDVGTYTHDIVLQAKREGWPEEKAALQIVRAQAKVNQSVQQNLRIESRPIIASPIAANEAEQQALIASIIAGAKK